MCAILDVNVAAEVFGATRTQAGKKFFDWVNQRQGRLVAGGKLREELNKTPAREWARQAQLSGQIKRVNKCAVEALETDLRRRQICRSNDPHVIALAQISGARLLYSNDRDLQDDFGNRRLVDGPRGKVYSTLRTNSFTKTHRDLLARAACKKRDLCQVK